MTNEQLTDNLKLLASALKLSRHDVAAIVCEGGMKVSPTHADKWLRGKRATKAATGNSENYGEPTNRTDTIKPDEFHAFCVGLKIWLDKNIEKE
ncbi:hypothetical protein ROL03_20115 [Cronobacter sakazakii]|uniref:hypothetical protein n=1 Tax=Cronobacter TaxID=413496 RepID=UPI00277B7FC2|nr:hypothetical protein [Cronobacter sakazakii]EKM5066645.1 hypothetical protein [Cronobacter turicensis]ELY9424874.1 hypothetical protein [Cronobacter dublinensis]EKY1945920.1 hypothetical protein [Cronobacter turicensis]EKY1996099.1 hypothetical protein [Cronobacter turicensis]ELQ6108518.1 hypothetical protein [Cronobacter turicensis]